MSQDKLARDGRLRGYGRRRPAGDHLYSGYHLLIDALRGPLYNVAGQFILRHARNLLIDALRGPVYNVYGDSVLAAQRRVSRRQVDGRRRDLMT